MSGRNSNWCSTARTSNWCGPARTSNWDDDTPANSTDDGWTVTGSKSKPRTGGRGPSNRDYNNRSPNNNYNNRSNQSGGRYTTDRDASRSGSGGYRGGRSHNQRKVAQSIKETVNQEIDTSIGRGGSVMDLNPKRISEIMSAVCREQKASSERDRSTILATVLGNVIKLCPSTGADPYDYIVSLKELIQEVKSSKGATGYDLLNKLSWIGKDQDVAEEHYLRAFEALILVCECNVLEKNARGETALSSYQLAVHKGYAPHFPSIEDLLSSGIRKEHLNKLLTSLINKFSDQKVDVLGNIFKLGYTLDPDAMTNKFMDNMLATYTYSKTLGYYQWIQRYVETCRMMLAAPIVDDEWKPLLEAKFGDSAAAFTDFMSRLGYKAMNYDIKTLSSAKHAIDVLGAVIGEASFVLGCHKSPYSEFALRQLADIKDTMAQNQLMTATAHLVKHFGTKTQHEVVGFITVDVFQAIAAARRSGDLSLRVGFQLEGIFKALTGKQVDCDKFDQLPVKLSNAGKVMAKKKKKSSSKKPTAPRSGMFDLMGQSDEEESGSDAEGEKIVLAPQRPTRKKFTEPIKPTPKLQPTTKGGKSPPIVLAPHGRLGKSPLFAAKSSATTKPALDKVEKVVEKKEVPVTAAPPLDQLLDTQTASKFSPRFMRDVDPQKTNKKSDGEWTDAGTDDYVYNVQMSGYSDMEPVEQYKVIVSVAFGLTSDVLPGNISGSERDDKLRFFRTVAADVFGEAKVIQALKLFIAAKNTDMEEFGEDFVPSMWDAGFPTFQALLESYGLNY